jgi:hypothetical protein
MHALQRFEDWVNRLIEGRLAALLGAQLQPVEIAKRLADHMEDRRTVGAGRLYVPNNYRVFLAPATLVRFGPIQAGLEGELAAFLAARARERGYHFVGRARVTLLADEQLGADRLRIEADLVDKGRVVPEGAGQATQAIPIEAVQAPPPAPTRPLALVADGDRRFELTDQPLALGRALDNDVILADTAVSRHHARVVPRGDHWVVEDLSSTYGTFVNGHRITTSLLRPGDQLRLGSAAVRVVPVGAPEAT